MELAYDYRLRKPNRNIEQNCPLLVKIKGLRATDAQAAARKAGFDNLQDYLNYQAKTLIETYRGRRNDY